MNSTGQNHGDLEYKSILSMGTVAALTLPRAPTPSWYTHQIDIKDKKYIFIVDDDEIMKDAWKLKLKSHSSFKGQILRFKSPEEFAKLAHSYRNQIDDSLILMDYHFANSDKTGVDAIKEHGIQKNSILVSGFTDLPSILDKCLESEIRFLPKQLISQVIFR